VRKRAGSVLLAAGMTALVTVVVLSAAMRGPWFTEQRSFDFPFLPGPVPTLEVPDEVEPPPEVGGDESDVERVDLTWAILLAGVVLTTLLILLLLRFLQRLRRPIGGAQTPLGRPTDLDVPPEPDIPVLLRGVSAARELLTRFAEPSDAVVAAWLALEEAAERSGVHRRASATPTEFTMAVLAATPAPPDATRELLGLYRSARFSTHPITAADLERAARCLGEIAESFTAAAGAAERTGVQR
jgi:Domain of unknown function (DUF4129)